MRRNGSQGYIGQAKLISTLPGYEAGRPENDDLSNIDHIRLVQRQLAEQGLETFLGELNQKRQTKRDEINAARPIPEPRVYYMRIQNLIKIGYTTRSLKRRAVEVMADEILASEPGGRPLEQMRHKQFEALRYRGERFHPGVDLMRHIDMIREHYRDHQDA